MGVGDTFGFYKYTSDNGNDYVVKLSAEDGTKGGFTAVTDALSLPPWPFNSTDMRHVWGKSSSGTRTRLPLGSFTNTLYVTGGSFLLRGVTYQVQGAIGEKRALSHIGG